MIPCLLRNFNVMGGVTEAGMSFRIDADINGNCQMSVTSKENTTKMTTSPTHGLRFKLCPDYITVCTIHRDVQTVFYVKLHGIEIEI